MNRRNPLFWPFWVSCSLAGLLGWAAFTLPAEPAAAPTVPEGIYAYAPRLCTYVDARVLAAGVAETVTVPANMDVVFLTSSAGTLYLRVGGTAAAPSGDVTDGTGSEIVLSGSTRRVTPAQTFSVVNTANATLTLCYNTAIRRLT